MPVHRTLKSEIDIRTFERPVGISNGQTRVFESPRKTPRSLTQQFLAWVAEAPRSYADAEAWRRSCPHLFVWEDAIADGLIQFENGSSMQKSRVVLMPRGQLLNGN